MAALDLLAPDQRAVVGLVLQQGRSYQEIADLLGISRSAVRSRAHAGLRALAPADAEVPADEAAQLADFLLGQQDAAGRDSARELIAGSSDARRWAGGVAARLRELAPERVPELDGLEGAPAPPPGPAGGATGDASSASGPLAEEGAPDDRDARRAPPRSSRLGGALLIAGTVLVVGAVIAFLVLQGGDDEPTGSAARATATPTATPRVVGQVPLRAAGAGARARATMALFLLGSQLGFQIQARDVPANRTGETYAVWFTGPGSKATLIGVTRDPVGKSGALVVRGPPSDTAARFPQLLAAHRRVVVSRERTAGTGRRPGPAVLRGTLPSGSR